MASPRWGVVMCVAAVVLCGVSASGPLSPPPTLYRVSMVHRHGSRTPLIPKWNASVLCGWRGCGVLNTEGFEMLRQLGRFTRGRYVEATGMYPGFLPHNYSSSALHTRSTQHTRTIQSATGFLTGTYPMPNPDWDIDVTPKAEDFVLDLWQWPSVIVRFSGVNYSFVQPTLQAPMDAAALKLFDPAAMLRIGAAGNLTGACIYPGVQPSFCLMQVQDLVESLHSTGRLDDFPILAAARPKLNDFMKVANFMTIFYNASSPFFQHIGNLGYPLASRIHEDLESKRTQQFVEYSAHDTTLMPLYSALGNQTLTRPFFAEAIFFEGHVDAVGQRFIRAFRGWPEQTPGNHDYTFESFTLHCMTANGSVYSSTPDMSSRTALGCPLEDWKRFVDGGKQKPRLEDALCYVDAGDQRAAGCAPNTTHVNWACGTFRKMCPNACDSPDGGPQRVLNGTSLLCVRKNVHTSTDYDESAMGKLVWSMVFLVSVPIGYIAFGLTRKA